MFNSHTLANTWAFGDITDPNYSGGRGIYWENYHSTPLGMYKETERLAWQPYFKSLKSLGK
jgi:hypothetical protein